MVSDENFALRMIRNKLNEFDEETRKMVVDFYGELWFFPTH